MKIKHIFIQIFYFVSEKISIRKIYNNNEFKIYNIMKDLSKYI